MSNLYDYAEIDEVLDGIPSIVPLSYREALDIIKQNMPGESWQVTQNAAEALYNRH